MIGVEGENASESVGGCFLARIEHARCPKCRSKDARVVYRSKDGKTVVIQCPELHEVMGRKSPVPSDPEYVVRRKRNQVFITDLEG